MLWNALTIALREIRRNLLRGFLTVLGVVIGVAAVVIMVSLGQGATESVTSQVESLGSNLVMAIPGQGMGPGGGSAPGFQLSDVTAIAEVKQDMEPWVSRLTEDKPARYSRALLETLALVAYRQPVTRGEIEDIRGVSVSTSIMKTLQEREWVRIVGHRDVPGRPAMYGTTKQFLDYFNLKSLNELPTLSEIKDLDQFHPELAFSEERIASGPRSRRAAQRRRNAARSASGHSGGRTAVASTAKPCFCK